MKKLVIPLFIFMAIVTACNPDKKTESTSMTDKDSVTGSKQERNKKIVMASIEGANSRNPDAVMKDAADVMTDYGDGSQAPMHSRDSAILLFKAFFDAIPDYKGENIMLVAEGDQVIAIGDWSGTFKNDFMGMKATNKSFKIK